MKHIDVRECITDYSIPLRSIASNICTKPVKIRKDALSEGGGLIRLPHTYNMYISMYASVTAANDPLFAFNTMLQLWRPDRVREVQLSIPLTPYSPSIASSIPWVP